MCLEAVSKQSYTNIETLLIDSHSTDGTRDIAASFGVKVIECDGKLLSARYLGWEKSKGEYIAFIDTDQVLEAKAIERAVALMDNYDREILEKAFVAIPQELIPEIIFYDHDIIYYESYKISQRVGVLRNAAYHIEPNWDKLWKTNYRYGASLRSLKKSYYWELFKKRGCGLSFAPTLPGLQTWLLAMILKVVQLIGYYFGRS